MYRQEKWRRRKGKAPLGEFVLIIQCPLSKTREQNGKRDKNKLLLVIPSLQNDTITTAN